MNLKLLTVATSVAVSAAVAQGYDDYESSTESTVSESSVEEAEPAPAPVAAAPQVAPQPMPVFQAPAPAPEAPAQNSQGLNVLHGNAYNAAAQNQGGASTIGGDMNSVYSMAGRNLVYVEPSGENGTVAFTSGSMTWLLGFSNNFNVNPLPAGAINNGFNEIGVATVGIAMNGLGIAVDLGIDKEWNSKEEKQSAGGNSAKVTDDEMVTRAGDFINLKMGFLLGGLDLTANVYWFTFKTESDTEKNNDGAKSETDNDYWDIGATVGLSNGPSANTLFWSVGLDFLRQKSFTKTKVRNTSTETTYDDAYILIQPKFNIAAKILGTASAQVLLGMNTRLPVIIYDEIEKEKTTINTMYFGLITTPNVLAEMSLTENWIIFGGASLDWKVLDHNSESTETGADYTKDESITKMETYSATADAGLRFQYSNIVVEASVGNNLGSSSWSGLIGNLGLFLIF